MYLDGYLCSDIWRYFATKNSYQCRGINTYFKSTNKVLNPTLVSLILHNTAHHVCLWRTHTRNLSRHTDLGLHTHKGQSLSFLVMFGRFHLFERRNQLAVFLQVLGGDLEGTDLIQRIQTLLHILARCHGVRP